MNDAAINQSKDKLQLMTTIDCSGNNTMINRMCASTFIEAISKIVLMMFQKETNVVMRSF